MLQASETTWLQRFEQHDLALASGNGHIFDYERDDYLSWGESYVLHSYLSAYEVTQDQAWLDKFVYHSSIVESRLSDVDNDGKLGLSIPRYAQNLIVNHKFDKFSELFSGVSQGDWSFENEQISLAANGNWYRFQANESMVYLSNTGTDGSIGVVLEPDGVDWRVLEYQFDDYEPATAYHFSCMAKSVSGSALPSANVRLASRTHVNSQMVQDSDNFADWAKTSVFFTSPNSTNDSVLLRLQTQQSTTSGQVIFDDCTLSKVDNNKLQDWQYWQSNADTVTAIGETVRIKTNPNYGWQVIQAKLNNDYTTEHYQANTKYQVKFNAKASPNAGGRVHVFDWTSKTTLATYDFDNTEFQSMSFDFTTPDEVGHDIQLRLTHADWTIADEFVWFDSVSVQQYAEFVIDDAMIVYPLTKFANLVKSNSALQASYQTAADRYMELASDLVSKWQPRWIESGNYGTYLAPDNGALRTYARCALPINQVSIPGNIFTELYKYTGQLPYLDKAQKLAANYRNYLMPHTNESYTWNYYENLFSEQVPEHCAKSLVVEDISHANLDVDFIVNAYLSGIAFTEQDIKALTSTFVNNMWNQSYSQPIISSRVNGSVDTISGEFLWWWGDLAQFDIKTLFVINSVWNKEDIYKIDTSTPIDPETGKWVAQGWRILMKSQLAKWFKNNSLLKNGDFAQPALSNWQRWQASSSNAVINQQGKLEITSANKWQVVQQDVQLTEGQDYRLFFAAKTHGDAKFYVQVYDWDADKIIALKVGSAEAESAFELNFRAPSSSHRVSIRLMPLDTKGQAHKVEFDNIILGKSL